MDDSPLFFSNLDMPKFIIDMTHKRRRKIVALIFCCYSRQRQLILKSLLILHYQIIIYVPLERTFCVSFFYLIIDSFFGSNIFFPRGENVRSKLEFALFNTL